MLRFMKGRLPNHPAWPLIKAHLVVENWPLAVESTARLPTRLERLEIDRTGMPIEEQLALLAIEMKCVACGDLIHPIKKRAGWRTLYVHVTCDTSLKMGCARSKAARQEIDAIVDALPLR